MGDEFVFPRVVFEEFGISVRINSQKRLKSIVGFAENDVEWEEVSVVNVAVTAFGIDGDHVLCVVVEHGMA